MFGKLRAGGQSKATCPGLLKQRLTSSTAFVITILLGGMTWAEAAPVKAIDPVSGSFSGTSPSGDPTSISTLPFYPVFSDGTLDYFGFPIPFQGSYSIAAYVGAVLTDAVKIQSFQLYNSTIMGTPGSAFATATYTTVIPNKYFALDPIMLAAGEYYLGVGTTGMNMTGPSGYSGVLSVALSTVPLPSSLPMFAGGLLALAGVSYGLSRRVTPKSNKIGVAA